MQMTDNQPIRDGEHFHDPSAFARLQDGILLREKNDKNLRFALQGFRQDQLASALVKALLDVTGSKGKTFSLLDAAIKEVPQ